MKALTDVVISLFDLAEAEGRLLQSKVLQTTSQILFLMIATLFLIIAAGLFLTASYQVLSLYLPQAGALFIVGTICLLLAGAMIWFMRYTNRQQ